MELREKNLEVKCDITVVTSEGHEILTIIVKNFQEGQLTSNISLRDGVYRNYKAFTFTLKLLDFYFA